MTKFLNRYEDVTDGLGRRQVVRNGYLPQRKIMTGIGPINTQIPKTRDKEDYVYVWADGIYFNIRSDDAKQCILVIIG